MSTTPSQDAPTSHLASVFYFNTPTKASGRMSNGRPIPPTPRKMMSRPSNIPDPLPRNGRRRSLVSAIPRPSSGSSRRASPSNPRNKPLPMLPKSESMLPYSQRPHDELSGLRQQLPVREYTKQTLTSPADVSVTLPLTTPARLPKSATTAYLVSRLKPRRPTPSRRLLGPVGPPLPHSQSTGNVSSQRSAPEVSIADAILESRMTQDEIDLLNQVQKEAVQNHNRLRAKYGSPHLSPASASSDGENHAMPGLQARRPDAVPLAVDTALANAAARQKAEQTHAVSNNSNDGTTEEDSINPKHVYFEQDISYWTGRYVTICDRLRGEALEFSLRAGSLMPTSPQPGSYQSYESQERQRMLTALCELRSCCRTEKARHSFEIFEQTLKQNMVLPSFSVAPSMSDSEDEAAILQAKARVHRHFDRSRTYGSNMVASELATPASGQRAKPPLPLPNIWERLSLTKSKTTGNLTDLSSEPAIVAGQRKPTAKPVITWHHRRKSSAQSIARSIPAAVREEENGSPALRAPHILASHRRQSSNVTASSLSSTKAGSAWEADAPRKPPLCHCKTSSGSFDRFDEIHPGVSVASIESGHPPAPQPPPLTAKSLPGSRTHGVAVGKERYAKSGREKHRRSSGETMKGIWQAGVDQVKRMGKRVGGSGSWAASSEDLNVMVSGGRK